MRHLALSLLALLWVAEANAAVKIKGSDIATNTITTSNLAFTPILSTPVFQGAGTQFNVSSGTVGAGGLTVLGELNLSGVVVSSHVRVTATNGTLGAGDNFFAFTAKRPLSITGMSGTVTNPGGTSGATIWSCGQNPGGPSITITTDWTMPPGTNISYTENPIQISAGAVVSCRINSSSQLPTPTATIELEYTLR